MAVHHGGKVGSAARKLASKSTSKSTKSKAGKILANHKVKRNILLTELDTQIKVSNATTFIEIA